MCAFPNGGGKNPILAIFRVALHSKLRFDEQTRINYAGNARFGVKGIYRTNLWFHSQVCFSFFIVISTLITADRTLHIPFRFSFHFPEYVPALGLYLFVTMNCSSLFVNVAVIRFTSYFSAFYGWHILLAVINYCKKNNKSAEKHQFKVGAMAAQDSCR